MSRRSLLLCALVAVALALFAAIWRSGDDGGTTPDTGEPVDAPPDDDPEQHPPSHIDPEDESPEDEHGGDPVPGDAAQSVSTSVLGEANLSGVVRDDLGQPWTSFRLLLRPVRSVDRPTDGRLPIERTVDDPVGRYTVPGLVPGIWRVSAEIVASSEVVQIELVPGEAVVDLVVPRPAGLAGRVEDPLGDPAPMAQVCVYAGEGFRRPTALPNRISAGSDGRFELTGIPPGALAIEAALAGFAPSERVEIEFDAGVNVSDVVIALRHPARILGVALDNGGAPDAGREVSIFGPPVCEVGYGGSFTTTDDAGRFVFSDLPPGIFEIHRALHDNEWGRSSPERELSRARLRASTRVVLAEGETVEIVLGGFEHPGPRLWGFVNGHEQVGARVFVSTRREGSAPGPKHQFGFVDEGGRYEILLDAPGEFTIDVNTEGGTLLEKQLVVADVEELRVDLELDTAAIGGRVLDGLGAPVEGAGVALTAVAASDDRARSGSRYAQTDAEGTFLFLRVTPGNYVLSTGPRGRSGGFDAGTHVDGIAVESGEQRMDIELRLPLAGAIDVLVEGPEGPLAGREVEAVALGRLGGHLTPRRTDPLGRTRIEGLAPGTWFVRGIDEQLACEWSGPVVVEAGAAADARVDLSAGVMLSVSVTGASLPGAELVVRNSRGFVMARAYARLDGTEARARASAVVGPLPFGRFKLRGEDGEGRAAEREIVIESAEPYEVSIELGGG